MLHRLFAACQVDVILEMLANVNLGNDLTVLAKGGCVAIIGNRGEPLTPVSAPVRGGGASGTGAVGTAVAAAAAIAVVKTEGVIAAKGVV